MPKKAAQKAVPVLHLDQSRRGPATKKGRPDRLIIQAAWGAGRAAPMTAVRDAVTCPASRATMVPLTPGPAAVPQRFQGKPAKPCADCDPTIYGTTVTDCVPCWKKRQAQTTESVA
jgi:hypothetical protein